MSKIDEAKALERVNAAVLTELLFAKRNLCLPGFNGFTVRATEDGSGVIRLEIATRVAWHANNSESLERFTRAIRDALEARHAHILTTAIEIVEAENRAAYRAAKDEARMVLRMSKNGNSEPLDPLVLAIALFGAVIGLALWAVLS